MRDWMKIANIASSEITDRDVFRRRRELLRASAAAGATGLIGGVLARTAFAESDAASSANAAAGGDFDPGLGPDEVLTSKETATSYNNFYELGTDKEDPARYANRLKTEPWSVTVDGECAKPGVLALEDVLAPHAIEERVYRLRCVEAWSMVIPWQGFPLGDLLKRFEPTGKAKYVAFETVVQEDLPGVRKRVLDWPYREGLRIDEAMHPLTFVATGMYDDEMLPNQNGAPLRLVVPWKYGFKSIKSIVRVSFTEKQPPTSWNLSAPHEYGFYSNVNPEVSHPRWSQAKERRLSGDTSGIAALFSQKIETRFLNGYAEEVASLYEGMDLARNF